MKTCKTCLVSKPLDEFHYYAPGKPSGKCKECHVEAERNRQKAIWLNNPEYRERHNLYGKLIRMGEPVTKRPVELKGSEKVCKVCNLTKLHSNFPLRGNHRLNTCITCYNEQENLKARKRYREDPEYVAKKKLSSDKARWKCLYNVDPETVHKTLSGQDNKCANDACGIEISLTAPKAFKNRAVIDHNHETGNFRALLCDRCNILLGHLEKNRQIVYGLEKYLSKFDN